MAVSIDIVIPSFRLNEKYLLPILQLQKPVGFDINFYLISDNPAIAVPSAIDALKNREDLHIIINEKNLGFSVTRNKGIDAGQGDWILLLDDDITPDPDLLHAYARAILSHPDALGFVGVTNFPPVVNEVTKALEINGVSTHFQMALREKELYWSATANIMLNRALLGKSRFSLILTKSTEDMELLFRNAFENDLKKYTAVPDAVVTHPWWGDGAVQTRRMFNYGEGAGEASKLYPLKLYTYYDFTNTTETLLILLLMALVFILLHIPLTWIIILIAAQLIAEFLTNYYKAIKIGHTANVAVAWQMLWHKNVMEAGHLWSVIKSGRINAFALRIDGSFRKAHPQSFRLNRWKIIKLSLFVIISLLLYFVSR